MRAVQPHLDVHGEHMATGPYGLSQESSVMTIAARGINYNVSLHDDLQCNRWILVVWP